ncbi:hypothetical protein OAU13_00695 [bacterium]|nr:hypothetical protein [bacterium]
MLVYTASKFKPKKKRKLRGVVAKKFDTSKYTDKKSVYVPTYSGRPPRPGSEAVMQAGSLETNACFTSRVSMTDAAVLAKEPEHIREAIIAKSKRIAIAYNKGAYQYVTDGTDPKTIGSGERLRRGG